jgi:uncharacterized protein involved in tolerance to divalent cations
VNVCFENEGIFLNNKIMRTKYCLITTTFDDKKLALKVANTLLEDRLISCVQVGKIKSMYHWK